MRSVGVPIFWVNMVGLHSNVLYQKLLKNVCDGISLELSFTAYLFLGPVVQSIVGLTSSLAVKMLTVLVSTIPNSQVFLLKKCE